MPDILVRNVSDDDLAAIDARARALGLSRSEYVRRALSAQARRSEGVDINEAQRRLESFHRKASDLTDDDIMRQAWSRQA